jgi:hypothetical protein
MEIVLYYCNRPFVHNRLDFKIYVFSRFYSYFPLMQTIGPIFMQSSIKINIIFLLSVKKINVVTTCEFSICYEIIL